MKLPMTILLSLASTIVFPLAHASQLNEFSVFQPVDGVSANIYIEKNSVMVQSTDTATTPLNVIRAEYLNKYSDQLYKIGDVDRNGTIDIATLDRVDRGSTRFCYKVYSYELRSRKFSTRPSYTECDSNSGSVIYATNSDVALNF